MTEPELVAVIDGEDYRVGRYMLAVAGDEDHWSRVAHVLRGDAYALRRVFCGPELWDWEPVTKADGVRICKKCVMALRTLEWRYGQLADELEGWGK